MKEKILNYKRLIIVYILYLLVDSLDRFIKTKNMIYILAFVYLLFFSFFYIFFLLRNNK